MMRTFQKNKRNLRQFENNAAFTNETNKKKGGKIIDVSNSTTKNRSTRINKTEAKPFHKVILKIKGTIGKSFNIINNHSKDAYNNLRKKETISFIKLLNTLYLKSLIKTKSIYIISTILLISAFLSIGLPKFLGFNNVITGSLIVISLNALISLVSLIFFVYFFFTYQKEHGFDLMVRSWSKNDKTLIWSKALIVAIYSYVSVVTYIIISFSLSIAIYDDKLNVFLLYLSTLLILPIFIIIFGMFIIVMSLYLKRMNFILGVSLFSVVLLSTAIAPVVFRNQTNASYSKSRYSRNYVRAINIQQNKTSIFEVLDNGIQPMNISSNNNFTEWYPFSFLTAPMELMFGMTRNNSDIVPELIEKSDRYSSLRLNLHHVKGKIKIDELLPLDIVSIFELSDKEKEEKIISDIKTAFSKMSDINTSRMILSINMDDYSVIEKFPSIFGATKSTFSIHEFLEKQRYIGPTIITSIKNKLKSQLSDVKYLMFMNLLEKYNTLTSMKLEIKKNISEFIPIKGVFDPIKNIISNDLEGMEKLLKFDSNSFVIQNSIISINELNSALKTNGKIQNINDWKQYVDSHKTLDEARMIIRSLQKINSSIHFIFSENSFESINQNYPFIIQNNMIYKSYLMMLIILILGTVFCKVLVTKKIQRGFLNKRK
ncbi:MAG: hypothetical protein HRT98_02125 [Mycoplasmatales bacterium]|nr:hypothetical protein [Mycoplasmatales bacterium]